MRKKVRDERRGSGIFPSESGYKREHGKIMNTITSLSFSSLFYVL
jgi:hypothetical protein